MATYLVTGGAGFIGSHLAEALAARGSRVRILDDFSTGKRENLRDFDGKAEIVEGSVMDQRVLTRSMAGVEYVLHQAAFPSVAQSIKNPSKSLAVNALGTLGVLEAARQAKVKRVVIASSSSVYGDNPVMPKTEGLVCMPLSPYAASKEAAEQFACVYHKIHGLQTIALRYFNVFGPRQNPHSPYAAVIARFVACMARGQRPEIFGDGKQSRDFTYVDNVVRANILACEASSRACGRAYNIASGKALNLLELIECLNTILGVRLAPVFSEPRAGDVRHSLASIARAKKDLGYRVQVPFLEGLGRTVSAFLDKQGGEKNDKR